MVFALVCRCCFFGSFTPLFLFVWEGHWGEWGSICSIGRCGHTSVFERFTARSGGPVPGVCAVTLT